MLSCEILNGVCVHSKRSKRSLVDHVFIQGGLQTNINSVSKVLEFSDDAVAIAETL